MNTLLHVVVLTTERLPWLHLACNQGNHSVVKPKVMGILQAGQMSDDFGMED